nr:SDR family oxidoreductase [Geitlerinema sp. P-1104]
MITGAANGIGAATAKVFQEEGWRVLGLDKLPIDGNRCDRSFQGDVSSEKTWQTVADDIAYHEGKLDGLVNNAALQVCQPLVDTSLRDWNRVISVNLTSIYLGVRYLHGLLKFSKGAILNVSSVHALATSTNIAAYAASKGGVVSLTRALAVELAADGIRANAILPGAVDTRMLREGLNRGHLEGSDTEGLLTNLADKHLIGRIGQPREIAQAIYFLVNDERASFITGQKLVIDGGVTVRLSTE